MASWFNGHESEQTLGDSERQGSLACYSSQNGKESDMTVNEQQTMIFWSESINEDQWKIWKVNEHLHLLQSFIIHCKYIQN